VDQRREAEAAPDACPAADDAVDTGALLPRPDVSTDPGIAITAGDKRISEMGLGSQVKTCAGDVCVTGGLSP
jgi:hypothetical protein